jgi:thiol-disulfide isomerase/thioredoxin
VGKAAPDFRLKKLGGGEIALSEFKGKVVLLDFWATWCAPCRAEMPEFEKLHKELAAKDVAILAVDADEAEETVADFIKHEKYTMPVLLTEGTDTIRRYGITAYPTTMAVDKEGRVAEVVIGNSSDAGRRLRAAIDKARAGAPAAAPGVVLGGLFGGIPAPAPTAPPPPPPAVTAPAAITAEDFYRDGYRLRAARDFQGAIAAYDRALALHRDWLPAIVDRANCFYQLKRYDQAIAGMTDAIRLDSKRAASYHERGLAYSGAGRYSDAIADYSRALELAPSGDNYSHRGYAQMELGKLEEALADLNKALELSPSNDPALNTRSRVFLAQKQYARVVEDCEASLRMNPKSAWAGARKEEALRAMGGRPGSLAAPRLISPEQGKVFDHFPRQTTLVWGEVPGAASYRIEWDYQGGGSWTEHPAVLASKEPTISFSFVGAQPGRWRVWAVDAGGREGAKSEWREFEYTR